MENTYTVEQIRTYLSNVDSFGDALYYLDKIDVILKKAAEKEEDSTEEE